MAASSKIRGPKAAYRPSHKKPHYAKDPESSRTEKPNWQIGIIDIEGPWSPLCLSGQKWWMDVFPKFRNFETMTWQEILSACGGRARGTNSHEIPVADLIPAARKRLEKLNLEDEVQHLFSLRLDGRLRIWGILQGRTLRLLWYDPNHEICPTSR